MENALVFVGEVVLDFTSLCNSNTVLQLTFYKVLHKLVPWTLCWAMYATQLQTKSLGFLLLQQYLCYIAILSSTT